MGKNRMKLAGKAGIIAFAFILISTAVYITGSNKNDTDAFVESEYFIYERETPAEPVALVEAFDAAGVPPILSIRNIDHETFNHAIQNPRSYESAGLVVAGVVPHHVTAASLISGFFSLAAANANHYDTVIILAPNHEGDLADIILSCLDWDIGEGLTAHKGFVNALTEADGLHTAISHTHMETDHSASILIPFIHHYLPDTKVAPILLNRSMNFGDIHRLFLWINEWIDQSGENLLLVASIDFSHFLSINEAREKDLVTAEAILNKDYHFIHTLNSHYLDCPEAMIIFLMYLDGLGLSPKTIDHTDASVFLGPNLDETTSYKIMIGIQPPPWEPVEIRIQFAGDILLHRGPLTGARIDSHTYDFRPFLSYIQSYINGDLAIANMESPVDALGNNNGIESWPLFNAPYEILEGLRYAGFNHLIHANNHVMDKHWQGMLNTLDNFKRAGFTWTGAYATRECSAIPTILDINGIMVGVLAYTDSLNGLDNWVPADISPYAVPRFRSHTTDDVPRMAEDIKRIRTYGAEFVIVSFHWGAEYVSQPNDMQRRIAQALVESGADVIMGHHSHTVQPVEWFIREDGTRGLIMYSLGNFMADQIGLDPPVPHAQYGMLVSVNVRRDERGFVYMENAEVLPTVFIRDRNRILGASHHLLPLARGEVPEGITDSAIQTWGRSAYEHVTGIIDSEFIKND
jgi:poly-gamma-glutamate synthesis protein (capsule biosynthesis protein)